jgi:hypothetical protein
MGIGKPISANWNNYRDVPSSFWHARKYGGESDISIGEAKGIECFLKDLVSGDKFRPWVIRVFNADGESLRHRGGIIRAGKAKNIKGERLGAGDRV